MSKLNYISPIFIFICSSILLCICQCHISRDDLIGVYAVSYPYGTEQLKLMQDGTYEQKFALTGQELKSINNGTWEIGSLSDKKEVLLFLYDPVIVDDGFGQLSKSLAKKVAKKGSSIWPLNIRKSLTGKISFPVNEDQGFVFKRIQ